MAAEVTQPANAVAYCREKAAPAGSNLHYALLFVAAEKRDLITALFALHYEVTETLTASTDPGVTRIKLNWWLEEIARLAEGKPRHPVTTILQTGLDIDRDIPLLQQYIATVESVASGRLAELSKQEWYEALLNGLGQICAVASRHTAKTTDPASVRSSGGTVFMLELLQNSLPLLTHGYRLFPDGMLADQQLTHDTLLTSTNRAANLFGALITQTASRLELDYNALGTVPDSGYLRILNRISHALCDEIAADGYQLLHHRIALTPIRKFWIAVRTHYLG